MNHFNIVYLLAVCKQTSVAVRDTNEYEFFRDNFNGKKVVKLEYEAYIPMAKKKLKELCNRLRVKWADLHHIAIQHRLGLVGPCEVRF